MRADKQKAAISFNSRKVLGFHCFQTGQTHLGSPIKWSPRHTVRRWCYVTASTYGMYSLNLSPKWHEDICQVTMPWGKGNTLIFQEPVDIRFELTLIPGNSKCHCATLTGAEIDRGQMINGVWTQAPPQWVPWVSHHSVVIFGIWESPLLIPWPVEKRLCGRQRQSRGAPDMPLLHFCQDDVSETMQQLGYCRSYHHHQRIIGSGGNSPHHISSQWPVLALWTPGWWWYLTVNLTRE